MLTRQSLRVKPVLALQPQMAQADAYARQADQKRYSVLCGTVNVHVFIPMTRPFMPFISQAVLAHELKRPSRTRRLHGL